MVLPSDEIKATFPMIVNNILLGDEKILWKDRVQVKQVDDCDRNDRPLSRTEVVLDSLR